MMEPGMNIDPRMHVQVLESRLAQAAVREAQMEAAIQQLIGEGRAMREALEQLENPLVEVKSEEG